MTQDSILSNLLVSVGSAFKNRPSRNQTSNHRSSSSQTLKKQTLKKQTLKKQTLKKQLSLGFGFIAIALLATTTPALAHHPLGGNTPQTIMGGLLSGVGHPVIGIDHLAFVIAVGLLAATVKNSWTVPSAFLMAALTGTGIRLMEANLPAPEVMIAGSVFLFGLLAISRKSLSAPAVVALTGLAGIFHGYAYGEAIIGAEPTPIAAYLIGFTLVQGFIAFAVCGLFKRAVAKQRQSGLMAVRMLSAAICGVGAVLLAGIFA